jgi:DNA/RNA endonuclease YhcR with UshA esterase domain
MGIGAIHLCAHSSTSTCPIRAKYSPWSFWGSDRPKFGTPETTLMGKRTCATGVIQCFRGKAEINAADPRQLVVQQRR